MNDSDCKTAGSPMLLEHERLMNGIAIIESLSGSLAERLDSLLCESGPLCGEKDEEAVPTCVAGANLRKYSNQIFRVSERLDDILSRLQL